MICQGCAWAVGLVGGGCVVSTGGGGGGGSTTPDGGTDGFLDSVDTGTPVTAGSSWCEVVAQPGAAGWQELPFSAFPDLQDVGGWVQTNVGGRTLNVAQVSDDCFVAMETSCTHQGGRVDYRPDSAKFVCTLHGAAFDNEGEVISGPTAIPLVTYPAARSGSSVWVLVG